MDLVIRLGRQLKVDAVFIYSIYISTTVQTADIIFIDIKTKKVFSKRETIYPNTFSDDIKYLTEVFLIDYVDDKYSSDPNYETIFWDFIKNSQNVNLFQQYLIKFPDGVFANLAKNKIAKISKDKFNK